MYPYGVVATEWVYIQLLISYYGKMSKYYSKLSDFVFNEKNEKYFKRALIHSIDMVSYIYNRGAGSTKPG